MRAKLSDRFGGAWLDNGTLKIGVLDEADAAIVRAAGAAAVPVSRSEQTLNSEKLLLDKASAPADVYTWYVDPTSNSVVVEAATADAARSFASKAGVSVRTRVSEAPRPLYDIRGGDQYVINRNVLCSVGFSVDGGFVTAGHCGGTGSPTLGYNNVDQGTFAGSSFPGNDYAWVRTNSNWTPTPYVNDYAGGSVAVSGSQEAGIGASVCRSGRTSGWHCGTIQAKDVTANYSNGPVYGLTSTNACAEGGDSGGAWLAGNQAQGVTSGGSGDCKTGGGTLFQPLNEILSTYGLRLSTTGGGSSNRIIGYQDKCVDVPNSNGAQGQRLATWDCNGGANQNWTFAGDGTVRALGLCMDVNGGGNANGTAIQLWGCNGSAAQQFVLSGAGDLVNPQANKCVDITGFGGIGTPLELWDCTGGANQKWRRG
ncbi:ricin-type beta-trefoil lectin domain protein [Umezawaea sp. Da 62-37]|uniref:ricin-type beta-trefoil lectin domain protein n=1 Tax=Umezawaea sp. Da 62-37 TaxID=3075927 RepID=UPI0028F71F56|nr:ricin-type beta-trefoil lectin domain protein [Umezawaea sp. Da 62-37]WNV82957.1 ricin-type beta-trefoil lectin domain protein [Umezawaea sp. Da 62-37]